MKAKDHILFLIVITQSRTFSLKLGTSIKNFLTTKYYLESYFQKEWENHEKIFFQIF